MTNVSTPETVLYLGISGVLHPSSSVYFLVHGGDLDRARKYEGVPLLAGLLEPHPEVKIVLTSTVPWKYGLEATLDLLGSPLRDRVVGYTFHDLTTKYRMGRYQRLFDELDYWRCDKARIVRMHVELTKPRRWIALDDEQCPSWNDEPNVVLVRGAVGLLGDADAQCRLAEVLRQEFGEHQ